MIHNSSFVIHNSSFITIVGLGNPGKEYERTRHNAGRTVVRCFARKHDFPEFAYDKKTNALLSEGEVGGARVALLLPETFMNNSGLSLQATSYKLQARSLIVVHDELDVPIGSLKVSFGKSSAGHKGVESVINALGTKEFTRIRIGIAPAGENGAAKKPAEPDRFVLQKFSPEEREKMQGVCEKARVAIETIVAEKGRG